MFRQRNITTKMFRLFFVRFKPVVPIIVGLCVGFCLSLICYPVMDTKGPDVGCPGLDNILLAGRQKSKKMVVSSSIYGTDEDGNPLNEEDFEPVLRTGNDPQIPNKVDKHLLVRTRYVSAELQIREKLFVGVVVKGDVYPESTTIGINKTLGHHVSKLVFFAREKQEPVPESMEIVSLGGDQAIMSVFRVWDYIYGHFGHDYDWYLLIPDTVYLYGGALMEFVGHMSLGHDVYMGMPVLEEDMEVTYCKKEAGYLLSSNLLLRVGNHWNACMERAWSSLPDLEVARCIKQYTGAHCSNSFEGSVYRAYNFQDKVLTSRDFEDKRLQEALAVYHVIDQRSMYKLHKFSAEMALNRTYKELKKLQTSIKESSKYGPPESQKVTWPTGYPPPFNTTTRFEVFDWEYFTMTHIFGTSDIEPKISLGGADKVDIDEVVTTAMGRLNEKYDNAFTLGRLVNGYRRFDPTRGMEYTLDLELKMTGQKLKKSIQKRVHLLRPLNKVEIIPMPYVTEQTQVTLILPVQVNSQDQLKVFLEVYTKVCIEAKDKSSLMIIFIYSPSQAQAMASEDVFGKVKGYVSYLEKKHTGAQISWLSVKTTVPSLVALMDVISTKFSSNVLFLLSNVFTEISIEFLNRVRMNTIDGWQVFFPIPFAQYDPNIIYNDTPDPGHITIIKGSGIFDKSLYEHASFYRSDYVKARKLWDEKHPGVGTDHIQSDLDLFEMFLNAKVHVLRAVDPALKQRFKERFCRPTLTEERYHQCLASRAEGLASRSQLAKLIWNSEKELEAREHSNSKKV